MSNPHYLRGVRLERELVNLGRAHNWIAFRSAGSHSCVDCVWMREKYKLPGTAMEGLELLRMNNWLPEPDSRLVPEPFLFGFYRFTRGLNKHWIWVRVSDDGMTHCLFIQCKTKLKRKG
jgi:hypothetical protein